MCLSTPSVPKPTPVQEAKAPDSLADQRNARKNAGKGPTSLLTGPSGVQTAASNLGANTLLGG